LNILAANGADKREGTDEKNVTLHSAAFRQKMASPVSKMALMIRGQKP
jgi:hypothetical protein